MYVCMYVCMYALSKKAADVAPYTLPNLHLINGEETLPFTLPPGQCQTSS